MSDIGWTHPIDNGGQWEGLNDSGIFTFKTDPLTSLGRETTQNSSDEVLDPSKPVSLHYDLIEVKVSEIPDANQFIDNFKLCKKAAMTANNIRAERFFNEGLKLLEKTKIPVLRVADFNTNGIKGPCEYGTPFYAFMKATGESVKNDQTAGGSYGIGKNAPYGVSDLRTVFVSTAFLNANGDVETYYQAKSILMSHKVDNKIKRAQGYWGVSENCMPVQDSSIVPDWLHRPLDKNTGKPMLGTTLFILGFSKPKNWKERLSASILSSFFGTISNGKLEVHIND